MCTVLPSVTDQSICKRLITCVLAALRANGMHFIVSEKYPVKQMTENLRK